jgi:hypothetical protein
MQQYMDTCRRRHPLLHRLAHKRLWRYFPASYHEGRRTFRTLAAKQGLQLSSQVIKNDFNMDLSMDVAVRPGPAGSPVLLHVAGTRGVDGFVGGAVQRCLLRHLPQLLPPELTLVLVHCANPFGMAAHRLVDEQNVDLEHNHMTKAEFDERLRQRQTGNPDYAAVEHLVNPSGGGEAAVCGLSFSAWLRLLWKWKRHRVYESISHGGQHWRMDGLAFGGLRQQPSVRQLLDMLEKVLPAGGGRMVALTLGADASAHAADTLHTPEECETAVLRMTLQHPHVRPLRRRNLAQMLRARYGCVALHQAVPLQASRRATLSAMFAENVQYHQLLRRRCARHIVGGGRWADMVVDVDKVDSSHLTMTSGGKDISECMRVNRPSCARSLHSIFALEEEQWREQAALRGLVVVLQAAQYLGSDE